MSKIVDSLKRLSMENRNTDNENENNLKTTSELTVEVEEITSNNNNNYVLALCGTQHEIDFRVGAALSNGQCLIYTVGESFNKTSTLSPCKGPIVDIKFSPLSKNIIYITYNSGKIVACDLRAKEKVVAEFKDDTTGKLKPLVSFDISNDERLLAGGTEHIAGDAFILFWDVRSCNSKINRNNNLLGGYWQSHIEDITSLSFHSEKRDALASGSTDGLINIYDLSQTSEDTALSYSLNTELSVDRIGWFSDDNLWCISHTQLQLWNYDGAEPYAKFCRNSMAPSIDPDHCYLVKMHVSAAFGKPFLLLGSSSGDILKGVHIGADNLEVVYNAVGNKQVVRDSWIHEKSGSLLTGGEQNIINVWKQTEPVLAQQCTNHKSISKLANGKVRDKHHRTKPY